MKDMKSKAKNIFLLNVLVFAGSHFIYYLKEIPMQCKTTIAYPLKVPSLVFACLLIILPFLLWEEVYTCGFKADEVNFIGT